MAPKEFVSTLAVMASFLVLLVQVPTVVSALTDISLIETAQNFANDDAYVREKNMPGLLKALGLFMNGHGKVPFDRSAQETSSHLMDASALSSLLDKILSSTPYRSSQEENNVIPKLRQRNNFDLYQVHATKRGRDDLSGAMPPLNELCRLLNVQCY